MRIRLPLGRSLFFLCAFLFAMLALLPLRLALDWLGMDEKGFAAREAKGSIWLGSLSEAWLGSLPLGDLHASMRSLPLLLGRARVDLERDDEKRRLKGSVTVSRHSFGIDDMDAALDIGSALAPLPIMSVDLTDVTARFESGLCMRAQGAVRANLSGDAAGFAMPAALTGNARCERGSLLLPLTSGSAMERVEIRIDGTGRYRADLLLRLPAGSGQEALRAAGFTPAADGGYALRVTGEF